MHSVRPITQNYRSALFILQTLFVLRMYKYSMSPLSKSCGQCKCFLYYSSFEDPFQDDF